MKFQPTAAKGGISIEFIEGSLNRFDGKTLSVAYGDKKPLSRRKFVLQMRKVIASAKANKLSTITINYKDIKSLAPKEMGEYEVGRVAGTAFVMADYEHNTYKTKPKDGWKNIELVAM